MEEKKKYYFPPVGLGLWYQYGVLHSLPKNENYDLYGSSGGSIICFTSILKEEDSNINSLLIISETIRKNCSGGYYVYLTQFLKQMLLIMQNYEEDYLSSKLSHIHIEVSEWTSKGATGHFIQPESLLEAYHLVIASCYVPFLFFHRNPFFYEYKNHYYFDGFFNCFSNVSEEYTKINSYQYSTLIPRSPQYNKNLYRKGCKYNFREKNCPFTLFIFLYISFHIISDLGCYFIDNMIYYYMFLQR